MTSLLLDTNTVSYILRGSRPALVRLASAGVVGEVIILSSVVEHEVVRGLEHRGSTRILRDFEELAGTMVPQVPDRWVWRRAAHLWADLASTGEPVTDLDLLIAAQALEADATLVTHNTRHFERFTRFGLELQDWLT